MNDTIGPDCPACGQPAFTIISERRAACGNDGCELLMWDPGRTWRDLARDLIAGRIRTMDLTMDLTSKALETMLSAGLRRRKVMSEHTTVILARALGQIPGIPPGMVTRAREGYYHDFLSPLAMPATQLAEDLRALAGNPATPRDSRPLLRAMAQQVTDGDFDASSEEATAWAASPEGQQVFRELAGGAS